MKLLYLLCLLPSVALAQWTDEQKVLAGITLAAMVVDYGQTMTIVKNPDKWHETNPRLGEHPTQATVSRYFVQQAVVGGLIIHLMPSEWRTWALRGMAVFKVGIAAHNYSIGISASF